MKKRLLLILLYFTGYFLSCCASENQLITPALYPAVNSSSPSGVYPTDYSDNLNWLSKPVQKKYRADVFYIYPTVCTTQEKTNLCKVNNYQMRKDAQNVFKLQAEAFDTVANIYAPYYTQYNFRTFAYSNYEKIQKDTANNIQGLTDIYRALDYYFKNLNQGYPYILAGHSQGSGMLLIVLSDYMKKHPEHYKNMAAAYVIGYPVTKDFLRRNPHLKFAKKSNDTGVIISYDVQSPNKSGINVLQTENQLVINPINWKRSRKLAKAENNLGSLDEKTLKITTPGIADAKIDKKLGVIICSTANSDKYEIPLPELFGKGSFHGQDFQFYFLNLRQNAKNRLESFIKNK